MENLRKQFADVFGDGGDVRVYFAPGRVNLIGEHTDYNGGHVFPCALTIGTYGVARKRDDRKLRMYSVNFPQSGVIESSLDGLSYRAEDGWTNYPKGVLWAAAEQGYAADRGLDIQYCGTIPNSSGLSSSASIEVLTGEILRDMFGFTYNGITNAKIGQRAENAFIGVNCGIMDQFAIAMGKKDHAIFLDTATLAYEYAPIAMEGVKIVIMNTNHKRGLGESKYNERRAECEEALAEMQTAAAIPSLGALTEAEFETMADAIVSPVCRKRAKHAVYENRRTIRAVEALKQGDLAEFGRLMNESHVSLRDDYEVTGRELDTLVEAAWKVPGVIGARMTGAGFGGCAVCLVKEENVEQLIREVGEQYERTIGYPATFYVVEIGDGPGRLG
ncbi:MAG: galactokinase [Lachnospiraceae bacterium]|nr:galactokinase [Lachnospiraceae bacterium]